MAVSGFILHHQMPSKHSSLLSTSIERSRNLAPWLWLLHRVGMLCERRHHAACLCLSTAGVECCGFAGTINTCCDTSCGPRHALLAVCVATGNSLVDHAGCLYAQALPTAAHRWKLQWLWHIQHTFVQPPEAVCQVDACVDALGAFWVHALQRVAVLGSIDATLSGRCRQQPVLFVLWVVL